MYSIWKEIKGEKKMIGVTGTDLLNTYFTILNIAVSGGCEEITPSTQGDVTISEAPSGTAFCNAPVASITSSVALSEDVYFVPAFDFSAITVNDSAVDVSDVVADGKSLYKLSSGSITKVSL